MDMPSVIMNQKKVDLPKIYKISPGQIWRKWNEDSGALLAGGLAFFGALAISPLIVISATAAKDISGKSVTPQDVYNTISGVVGPTTAGTISQTVNHSLSSSNLSILKSVALIFALLAGGGILCPI